MRLFWVFLVASFAVTLTTSLSAQTHECRARVEHVGNVIQGSRVYSHWRIGHSPWRWATISFRYQLTYVDEDNKEGKISGRFRDLIRGIDEDYVKLKNVRGRPARIIRTSIHELTCTQ